jgi:hypothetical protein
MTEYICEKCEITIETSPDAPMFIVAKDFPGGKCKDCGTPMTIVQDKDIVAYYKKLGEKKGYTMDMPTTGGGPEIRIHDVDFKKGMMEPACRFRAGML